MKKHKHPTRKETLQRRENEAAWEALKKTWDSLPKFAGKTLSPTGRVVLTPEQQAQRQLDKAKSYGMRYGMSRPLAEAYEQINKAAIAKKAFVDFYGLEAWEEREAKAKETVHTVVPLHKSNYILVTDLSLIEGMVSKSGAK